jgi:hypothetical protein
MHYNSQLHNAVNCMEGTQMEFAKGIGILLTTAVGVSGVKLIVSLYYCDDSIYGIGVIRSTVERGREEVVTSKITCHSPKLVQRPKRKWLTAT